jgi:hypothetical protein
MMIHGAGAATHYGPAVMLLIGFAVLRNFIGRRALMRQPAKSP